MLLQLTRITHGGSCEEGRNACAVSNAGMLMSFFRPTMVPMYMASIESVRLQHFPPLHPGEFGISYRSVTWGGASVINTARLHVHNGRFEFLTSCSEIGQSNMEPLSYSAARTCHSTWEWR